MSYQIQSTISNHKNSHHNGLTCQICQQNQYDIYVCKICLVFACHSCTQHRICTIQIGLLDQNCMFQRIYHQNGVYLDLAKKNMEACKKRFYEFPKKYIQQNGNCQRCLITSATRSCTKCQIKNYCEVCFKMVHNTSKMENHQLVLIKQNVQKIESKQINLNLRSNIESVSHKQIQNGKKETLETMQGNLNFAKNQIEQEFKNYQNQISKCINMVTHQFQTLIEDIQLKIVEITMRIKQHLKDKYEKYQEKRQSILSQQKIINNIKIITTQYSQLQAHAINAKIDNCYQDIASIMRNNGINFMRDPMQKKCQAINQEIQQIRQSVSKIEMKKNWLMLDTLKSSISISTPRGDKNSKNLKGSMFISSARSQKPNPLTMSQVTPKKFQGGNIKIQAEIDKVVSKLNFNQQQKMVNCPQDVQQQQKQFQLDKCLKFGINKKKVKQPTSLIDPKISLVSPKASMKVISGRNMQNIKCKIGKALNTQKSKKTIKQSQNQLLKSQFSSKLVQESGDQANPSRKQSQLIPPKTSRV